jgi:hypothetical protein
MATATTVAPYIKRAHEMVRDRSSGDKDMVWGFVSNGAFVSAMLTIRVLY